MVSKIRPVSDRVALELKEGDRVLYAKYGGTEFKLDGEEYLVLCRDDSDHRGAHHRHS